MNAAFGAHDGMILILPTLGHRSVIAPLRKQFPNNIHGSNQPPASWQRLFLPAFPRSGFEGTPPGPPAWARRGNLSAIRREDEDHALQW